MVEVEVGIDIYIYIFQQILTTPGQSKNTNKTSRKKLVALPRKYIFTFFRHDFKWKFPSTSVLLYILEIKEEEQRGRAKKSNCSSSPSILFYLRILSSPFYPLPNALPAALPLPYLFSMSPPPLIFHLFPLPLPIPYILPLIYSSTHLVFLLLLLLLIPLPLPHFITFYHWYVFQPSHASSYSYSSYPYYPTATQLNLFYNFMISKKTIFCPANITKKYYQKYKYQKISAAYFQNYHIVITFSHKKNQITPFKTTKDTIQNNKRHY